MHETRLSLKKISCELDGFALTLNAQLQTCPCSLGVRFCDLRLVVTLRSGKLQVLLVMVKSWAASGNRVLIFAQTHQTLDVIAAALASHSTDSAPSSSAPGNMGCTGDKETEGGNREGKRTSETGGDCQSTQKPFTRFVRIDGSTPIHKRHELIRLFQQDEVSINAFHCLSVSLPQCLSVTVPIYLSVSILLSVHPLCYSDNVCLLPTGFTALSISNRY